MKCELSQRELAVMNYAVNGYTDDMIAHELGIERGTVNSYWVRIRGKMGHLSRTELVARFLQAKAVLASEVLAADNKVLLDNANAEIERLRALLEEKSF
jgi:DNA-binding CsgD family transcriptional regulator